MNIINEDRINLMKRLPLEEGFLSKSYESFISNCNSYLSKTSSFIESNNMSGLYKCIHSIKGICLDLGACAMSNLCQKICSDIEREFYDDIVLDIERLKETYEETIPLLHQKIVELG